LIAGEALVPELIQKDASVDRLYYEVREQLQRGPHRQFGRIAQQLRQGGGMKAADALVALCKP